MKTKTVKIEAREGRVKLNDEVSKWSADDLLDDIEKLYGQEAVQAGMEVCGFTAAADDALETLHFEINSAGGSVPDGYRIFNALEGMKQRGVRVVATINGRAASMATVIAMAADHINITKGSLMLVHDASTVTIGTAEEHRKSAATLDQITAEIGELYAARTEMEIEDVRALMSEDRWMTAAEALKLGFVDQVITGNATAEKEGVAIRGSEGNLDSDMKIFQSRADLTAAIEAKDEQIKTIEADLTAAEAKAVEATESLAAITADLAVANQSVESSKAEIEAKAEKITELEASVTALQSEIEAAKESAGKLAAKEIAAAGHPPVAVDPDSEQSERPHFDKFEALEGAEASAYFKAHKAQILAEARR